MLVLNSKDITDLYRKSLLQVNALPNLENDPKNYKDTGAILSLKSYKNEKLVGISKEKFFSKYDYDQYIPGGNELMDLEIKHYSKIFFKENKLQDTISHLTESPYSKKAVLNFWKANYSENEDIPCVVYIWFRNRNGKLDMDCHMRANDAFRLVLMDLHIMTSIHAYVADSLEIRKGNYYHFVDSLHLYKRDKENIDKFVSKLQDEK